MFCHGPVADGPNCQIYCWNPPVLLPVRFNVIKVPRQIPEEGVAVDVPATGGATQGVTANSTAPTSGVVKLLAASLISLVIPRGSPRLSISACIGVKLPLAGSVY